MFKTKDTFNFSFRVWISTLVFSPLSLSIYKSIERNDIREDIAFLILGIVLITGYGIIFSLPAITLFTLLNEIGYKKIENIIYFKIYSAAIGTIVLLITTLVMRIEHSDITSKPALICYETVGVFFVFFFNISSKSEINN